MRNWNFDAMKTSSLLVAAICLPSVPTLAVTVTPDNIDVKKGVTASGGLNFNNTFYSGSDSLIKRDPYMYTLTGNLNVDVMGVALPFSFALSNTSKTYAQPFNRFQVTPQYKWVKAYFGSTNMNFSQYTLAGHEFRGAGLELTPGNWFIGGMYGRFNKAIEYDPLEDNINTVSYKRTGYAGKLGYTGGSTEVNATFFHAADEKESLKYYIPEEADLHPQENTAVSAFIRQSFGEHFFAQAEYAFSLYNTDIRTAEGEKANGSTFLEKMLGKKGNDRFVDAVNAEFGYQSKLWGLSLCFERLAPYYQTLGGYYFTDDKEDYSLAPYVHLFDGKLNISGKIGFEYNNLNNIKSNTTRRVAGSANVGYNSGKNWAVNASYSNFTNYTKYKQTAYPYYVDNLDTLNFYQVSQSLTGMGTYSFGNKERTQAVALTCNYQFANTEAGNVQSAKQNILSSSANFNQNFVPKKLGWGAFFSINYADATAMESLFWGPGVNLSKTTNNDAITASLTCAYNVNDQNGQRYSSIINSGANVQWSLKGIDEKYGKHAITGSLGLTNWLKNVNKSHRDYEFLATVNYSVSF